MTYPLFITIVALMMGGLVHGVMCDDFVEAMLFLAMMPIAGMALDLTNIYRKNLDETRKDVSDAEAMINRIIARIDSEPEQETQT